MKLRTVMSSRFFAVKGERDGRGEEEERSIPLFRAKTDREKSDGGERRGGGIGADKRLYYDRGVELSCAAILAQYGPKSKVSRERDIEWRRPYVAF